jgi:hypothetical protein
VEPTCLAGAGWSWPGLTRQLLAKPRSSTVTEAERAGQTTRRQPKNGGSKELLEVGSKELLEVGSKELRRKCYEAGCSWGEEILYNFV